MQQQQSEILSASLLPPTLSLLSLKVRLVQEATYIKIKPGYLPININQMRDIKNIAKNSKSKEISCACRKRNAPILCSTSQPYCDLKCLHHNLMNCHSYKQETREIFLS